MNSLFLFSALPDQAVTANKDKEPHGNGTQKDLAVIAGLFFSPLCCFIFLWLIENESQLFVICHSLHLPPSSLSTLSVLSLRLIFIISLAPRQFSLSIIFKSMMEMLKVSVEGAFVLQESHLKDQFDTQESVQNPVQSKL